MGSGADPVRFTNGYSATVNIAWMRRDDGCGKPEEGGDPWVVRGWRVLAPGQSTEIANSTENRWFYVFAEAVDGTLWTGPFPEEVHPKGPFNFCAGIGVGGGVVTVGFRELDTDAEDWWQLV